MEERGKRTYIIIIIWVGSVMGEHVFKKMEKLLS